MDVTDFLCVLLCSSTVQIHESLGGRHACTCSDAGFIIQNGDRAEEKNIEEKGTQNGQGKQTNNTVK
jgi:hypothetical protein